MSYLRQGLHGVLAWSLMSTALTDRVLAQGVVVETLALVDQAAPGTEFSFREFDVPIINASGVIVVRNGEFATVSGLWTASGTTLGLLVLGTDDAIGFEPSAATGNLPTLDRIGVPSINAGGDVAFLASTDFGPALYRANGRANLTLVAMVPGSQTPRIDSSRVLVFADVEPGGFGGNVRSAIDPDNVRVVAAFNQAAPNVSFPAEFQSFSEIVVSPGGNIAFHAMISGSGTGDDQAIFLESGGELRLVIREGDPVLDDPIDFGRTFEGLFIGNGNVPEEPTISDTGVVAFRAFTPSVPDEFNDTSIWRASFEAVPRLVASTGEVTVTTDGDVTFTTLGQPLLNAEGDMVFRGTDQDGRQGIWRRGLTMIDRLVRAGDVAAGTETTFIGFGPMVFNAAGAIAFEGFLDTSDPDVTSENDRGLWVRSADGAFALMVREGTTLASSDGTARVIDSFEFAGNSGNADGRKSGFSDNGDVTFFASFASSESEAGGIFRARGVGEVVEPTMGEGFIWSGDAGDNNWHTVVNGNTNWIDSEGVTVDPPDDAANATIEENADVLLDAEPVILTRLEVGQTTSATLEVRQPLRLIGPSAINGLTLASDLTVVTDLALGRQTEWNSGTIDLGTASSATTTASLTASDTFQVGSIETENSERRLTGTNVFDSSARVTQLGDLELDSGATIDNLTGGEWRLISGNLFGDGTFVNRGKLVKPADPNSAAFEISSFLEFREARTPDDAVPAMEVNQGPLVLSGSTRFDTATAILLDDKNDTAPIYSELRLGGAGNVRVAVGKTVTVTSDGPKTVFTLSENAVLSMEENADWVFRASRVFPEGLFNFVGGTIAGLGTVTLDQREFTADWTGGTIGVPGLGISSGELVVTGDALLSIIPSRSDPNFFTDVNPGQNPTVAGTLTVQGFGAAVTQSRSLTIDGGLVRIIGGTWEFGMDVTIDGRAGGTILTSPTVVMFDGEASIINGSLRINPFVDVTNSAVLDNTGIVRIEREGSLTQTGMITQLVDGVLALQRKVTS